MICYVRARARVVKILVAPTALSAASHARQIVARAWLEYMPREKRLEVWMYCHACKVHTIKETGCQLRSIPRQAICWKLGRMHMQKRLEVRMHTYAGKTIWADS